MSMTQNIVPFSKEAENYILGSILIDETVANDVCGVLNENDFHLPENQIQILLFLKDWLQT